jgi:hypothetical protein
MLEPAHARKVVEDVLKKIQEKQGLPCPKLEDAVRPLRDLEKFDSPMSIAATGRVGRLLGVNIPPEVNLFGDSSGLYTISQTVALLCQLADEQPKEPAGA